MNCLNLPQVMVSMAQHRHLAEMLKAVVSGIATCRGVVLARIWLIREGDVCATCRFSVECPDRSRCLHLVASAGNPRQADRDYGGLEGSFRRFPLGVRKIGRVGQTGEPLLLSSMGGNEDWVAEPEWIRREGIRSFAAQPLMCRGEILGVLGLFDSGLLGKEDFDWLRVFADYVAVSIVNARALEEIETLKGRLEEENSYLRDEVSSVLGANHLIGTSPALKKVTEQIQLVAPTDAAVLVTGESGTGKELVARAIHEQSRRQDHVLVRVNCSAIPEPLFESEFFGHVKGSFTGAIKDKPGRFELADGGTLFLDEIGEVPLAMQAKLLRVLQEQEIERIGDVRTRPINVRIIAATNRDLKKEVAEGRFRQDLFYRLSVFPIEIPPLRERREDIAMLAQHFVQQSAKRMKRPVPRLSPETLRQLQAQPWPGNVRELQNAVERAVILSQGRALRFDVVDTPPSERPARPTPSVPSSRVIVTREILKQQERENLVAALRESGGKIFGPDGAAALLGMKPTTLTSRIKAMGIRRRPND